MLAPSLPSGSGLPAIAQTAWFINRPRDCITSMRASHGDPFTLRALNGTVVMGCTPDHAKQLFTADHLSSVRDRSAGTDAGRRLDAGGLR